MTNEMHSEMFERPLIERYTFVMVTTRNLASARKFWVEQLGFPVTEDRPQLTRAAYVYGSTSKTAKRGPSEVRTRRLG